MARGRFTKYAERFGGDVGLFLNRAIISTLRAGLETALRATKQDSSLAAYHWMIVPQGGGMRPGARSISRFRDLRGQSPVGQRGDKGKNAKAVEAEVKRRETEQVLRKALKERVAVYAFYNATPGADDPTSWRDANEGGSSRGHAENAKITEAMDQAYRVMNQRFQAYFQRNQVRQRPIGGAGMADAPFRVR